MPADGRVYFPRSDGFFLFFQSGGEINEVVVREVVDFVDEGGEGLCEFRQGGILLGAGGGGDDSAQISYTLLQGGGHDQFRISKTVGVCPTVFRVPHRGAPPKGFCLQLLIQSLAGGASLPLFRQGGLLSSRSWLSSSRRA
jgi:hypothetical protein